ncbi:MAG: pilus assembly protein PilM, partial [Myxococcales bacterium]|nr:pilus assembly protein PilM [Myxococcales bacterium]
MAHHIVGLDIGTYSVKALRIRSGLRDYDIEGFDEEVIEAGDDEATPIDVDEDNPEGEIEAVPRQFSSAVVEAIERLHKRGALDGDIVMVGFSLGQAMQTRVQLPFNDRKRIAEILPMQIEEAFPVDLDELVTDFVVAPTTGPDENSHSTLVVGAQKWRLQRFLNELSRIGIDPRVVEVKPAALLTASHMIHPELIGTTAVLEIGHDSSQLCVSLDGSIQLLREIPVGGKDVTEGLEEAFKLDRSRAEAGKHGEAYVDLQPVATPASDDRAKVQVICQGFAGDLANELRRTFHGHLARGGQPVERLLICGAGALLRGTAEYLSAALGIPASLLRVEAVQTTLPG